VCDFFGFLCFWRESLRKANQHGKAGGWAQEAAQEEVKSKSIEEASVIEQRAIRYSAAEGYLASSPLMR
jgi:hypothetical protein